MIKYFVMGLRGFFLLAAKIWSFVCYCFKRQARTVIQHQTVRYEVIPLSPLSKHRLNQYPTFGSEKPQISSYSTYLYGVVCEVKFGLVHVLGILGMLKRKTLVLDLDETLIHSHHDGVLKPTVKPGTPPDFVLKVNIDRHPVRFFVHKRPHVDYFLEIVSQWYDLVVFTASMEIYGAAVADKLDNNKGMLRRRYYRQHCHLAEGSYTKNLCDICSDLSSIFILDNSPVAYRNYQDNAIPIRSWFSDPTDTALLCLLPMLDALRFSNDVRSVLSRNLHLHRT